MTDSVFQRADDPRARLISEIISELRLYSTHSQHIGDAFAARNQLGPADLHALILIMEAELAGQPITPGTLREELNFSSGSVTGVIDRLEAAGHVYRDRDTADRRKIFLRYAEPGAAVAREFFRPLAGRTQDVMKQFTDEELATVHRFLAGMVAEMREHRDELRAG
ncbi:DNA-binding MarR family transcriptional regulator [Hamadaea flava]|nr:DNA-binding MarR family transcriptional regulator [Hamadaea flava]